MLSRFEKRSVLIVEDEQIVAQDIQISLESEGLLVSGIAQSGREALEMFAEYRPGCTLLDIHLRGNLDGVEVARGIRDLSNSPFVFLTGYADDYSLERAVETGAFGYLVKPVNYRQLFATVMLALNAHSQEASRGRM